MALSDYDHLAYDQTFASIPGSFTSPLGVSVDLYKNWVYIRDPRAWRDGTFVEPTVAQLLEGDLRYMDVGIKAKRGPQRGIYLIVTSGYNYDDTFRAMIGIACSGWRRRPWAKNENKRHYWVGVSLTCLSFLSTWLASDECDFLPDELRIVPPADQLLRYNQGDAYLAEHLDIPAPVSEVGAAEQPLMIQAIRARHEPSPSGSDEGDPGGAGAAGSDDRP